MHHNFWYHYYPSSTDEEIEIDTKGYLISVNVFHDSSVRSKDETMSKSFVLSNVNANIVLFPAS